MNLTVCQLAQHEFAAKQSGPASASMTRKGKGERLRPPCQRLPLATIPQRTDGILSRVEVIQERPRTPTGKLLRRALRKRGL